MPSSIAQAAVRRCHKAVLTVVAGAALYGAGIAAVTLSSVAPVPQVQNLDARVPEFQIALPTPNIEPIPKPDLVFASMTPLPAVSPRDLTCLAQAVYYEARGESRDGQRAVAEVVIRRTIDGRYPKTVCGVVFQDAGRPGCQFSFACGHQRARVDWAAWRRAVDVANYELTGPGRNEDITLGATHFHTIAVTPSWSNRFLRTARIGTHIFYRQPGGSYETRTAHNGATS